MSDFVFRERGGVKYIVCEPLERAGFKNAFSTRLGGVSELPDAAGETMRGQLSLGNFSQDERERVMENRRRFLDAIGATGWALVTARQFHSAEVRSLRDAQDARGEPTACDALTANLPRTLLAVQTADCLSALIVDERTRAFAAESAKHFRREFAYAEELFSRPQPSGKANIDLNRANVRQLLDAGLAEGRVYTSGLCTIARADLFFSYRRERGAERPVGRLMSVVGRGD
jgi:polyphenol oxidase